MWRLALLRPSNQCEDFCIVLARALTTKPLSLVAVCASS